MICWRRVVRTFCLKNIPVDLKSISWVIALPPLPIRMGEEMDIHTWQKRLCDQPSFRTDFSSAPSRPEHSRNDPVGPSSAMHGLAEVLSLAPEDLPGTKDPVAACLLSMPLMVARVKPTRAAIAPCLMPSRASANTSCLIPLGVRWSIVQTIRKNFEKICKYWFKVVTVWRLIWGNDHLYCGFRARRSHLTLHWMSAQGSVGFRWETITGPYHANFSQVETQKFDPHWFYCLQWGCNNLFCQECTNRCTDRWAQGMTIIISARPSAPRGGMIFSTFHLWWNNLQSNW